MKKRKKRKINHLKRSRHLREFLFCAPNIKQNKKLNVSVYFIFSVKIIDDDVDLSQLHSTNDEDIEKFNLGEDAPQIVGVVDDRPPELIATQDYGKSLRWKTIGPTNDDKLDQKSSSTSNMKRRDSDTSPPRKYQENKCRSADLSPPRQIKRRNSSDASPPRRRGMNDQKRRDTDASPPRPKADRNSRGRNNLSPDTSPPRRHETKDRQGRSSIASSPRRKENRKKSKDSSLPRRRNRSRSPDLSPKRNKQYSSNRRYNRSRDLSPPRNRDRPFKQSYQRCNRSKSPYTRNRNRNASPSRRQRINSPSRWQKSQDKSPSRNYRQNSPSPSRNDSRNNPQLSDSPPPTHKKMIKTLDGKIAGLQNATALHEENDRFQRREEELYKKMTKDQSSSDDVNVRKTGRRRNLEQDSAIEMEKMKKEEERKAVYDRWGKGLKQIEEYQDRIADERHEENKPLARYSDDKDLDEYLKQQHRDGDPMAKYFQKKTQDECTGRCK